MWSWAMWSIRNQNLVELVIRLLWLAVKDLLQSAGERNNRIYMLEIHVFWLDVRGFLCVYVCVLCWTVVVLMLFTVLNLATYVNNKVGEAAISVSLTVPEALKLYFCWHDWMLKCWIQGFHVYNIHLLCFLNTFAYCVCVFAMPYRSDGSEVTVDNKFLKANHPVLVIVLPLSRRFPFAQVLANTELSFLFLTI